jgi:uncharacterized protein with von Willebrand factor type A (vWA) domain
MDTTPQRDFLLWTLFNQLRKWQFTLAPADYDALYQALNAGFGWESRESLRNLCCALWAKSPQEQEILIKLFDDLVADLELEEWQLPQQPVITPPSPSKFSHLLGILKNSLKAFFDAILKIIRSWQGITKFSITKPDKKSDTAPPSVEGHKRFPDIPPPSTNVLKQAFILTPQFIINYREIAQAWRRLRKLVHKGAKTELDIEATIEQRCRQGVVAPIVLVPRQRNAARVLLLIDRQGSMTPFHRAGDELCKAIRQSANLDDVTLFYFHNVPAEGANETVLEPLSDQLFPTMDTILAKIEPLMTGNVYKDTELLETYPLTKVLKMYAEHAAVVLLSDGGAARKQYNTLRLLDTVAFLKALRTYTTTIVWLNPLPPREGNPNDYLAQTTAAQIARHVPMFPLNRRGLHQAVNVLRGQVYSVESPLYSF